MSNYLAIATVTAALAQTVRASVQNAVAGSDVIVGRPESPSTGDVLPRVRLYLYQVTPNASLRNADLPSRGASVDTVVKRPCAALDLHYLLSFYGSETELQPQRMLGAVVRDLHARPFLTRQMVQNAMGGYAVLADSDLHQAVEQVRVNPINLSTEEQSKLWSVFFQTPHAVSVAYQASVVLIESEETPLAAMPVLQRGEQDRGVDTLTGPFPVIESAFFGLAGDPILQPRPLSMPAARMGMSIILKGRNLGGESVLVRFEHTRVEMRDPADQQLKRLSSELTVARENLSASELKVLLPPPGSGTTQEDWAPGVYILTVVDKRSGSDHDRTSNSLPFAFSPLIAHIELRNVNGTAMVTITCQPRVHKGQQAVLVLAGREIVGQIDLNDPDKVNFPRGNISGVTDALVRMRVDGIESMPYRRVDAPPPTRFVFDDNQRVTIP